MSLSVRWERTVSLASPAKNLVSATVLTQRRECQTKSLVRVVDVDTLDEFGGGGAALREIDGESACRAFVDEHA